MLTFATLLAALAAAGIGLRLLRGPAELRQTGKVLSEPELTRTFSQLATHEVVEMKSVDVQLQDGALVKAHIGTSEPIMRGAEVLVLGLRPNWLSPRSYSIVRVRNE